ncbi:MAG: restriction endonuclease subunit S [Anaerobiospirillum succiniciproducens]|uniref:restriction endonuclease subunit S n=1 Tax=Anaerobiospirillum succiniciproducens TaxID=13335 RepID=UPI002A759E5E|nr:restriction endonuclease subunit S [Anaerobiospirillum succiniciproducens]MDY2798601.1 restriction endonuclease subunit S [Anaerobiospirillum succiniciproducens]
MNQLLKFKQEAIYMDCCLNELGTFYGGLSGKTKEHFGTGDAKFVTYMNVFSNCIARKDQCECVLISDDEKQNLVKKGDILFTQSSETPEEVGMASIWTHDLDVYLNSFCFGFRVLDPKKTNPLYLTYLLRSPKYRQAISIEAQGISRYNLSSSRLSSLKLRLHSCEEQQKIAEFFTALDEKIQLKVHKKAQLEYLYKSLLEKLYSTTIDKIPLSEVATFHSGLTYKPTDVSDSGVIVLRSSNIQNNHIDLTDKVFVDMNLSSELKINEGDILMCIRNGSKNLVGKTALIDSTCKSYTWGAFMMVIRSKEQNNWVHHFLRSKKFRSQIDSDSNTATINQITKGMLNECLIPWPALETRVNSSKLLDLIERRVFITERMIFELNSLKKAFMQRMFV